MLLLVDNEHTYKHTHTCNFNAIGLLEVFINSIIISDEISILVTTSFCFPGSSEMKTVVFK